MWPILHLQRFVREKAAIEELAAASDWLEVGRWAFRNGYMTVPCRIRSDQDWIPVTLRYGKGFPYTPPSVLPEKRISKHQYGDGELCLQYRADNWMPHFSGVHMLQSARELFVEEKTTLDGPITGFAQSAHRTRRAQYYNNDTHRLVLTPTIQRWFKEIGEFHEARFATLWTNTGVRVVISGIRSADGKMHYDATVPVVYRQESLQPNGLILELDAIPFPLPKDRDRLMAALVGEEVASFYRGRKSNVYIAIRLPIGLRAWIFKEDEAAEMGVIYPEAKQRLPMTHTILKGKSVGLVGAGSLGSKVAASMVRSGLGKIGIFDDDIFEADNLVRGELDWSAVGSNKVEALRGRLRRISANVEVVTEPIHLGGQNSGTWTDRAVSDLAEFDLIIDATADPHAFNFISSAAVSGQKPIVWAEIYGGGFGGMVARARPGKDPTPYMMRELYTRWCDAMGKPAPTAAPGYEQTGEVPWIADDADVSVIAGHLSRFAIDILTRETSIFPYSLYLIGMREEWNFATPFHAIPMSVPPDADLSWTGPAWDLEDPATQAAFAEFLQTLVKDETPDQPGTAA